LVDIDGDIVEQSDKLCATKRRIVARFDATDLLRADARASALSVIHLWKAPDVVKRYLETGDESIRVKARAAAYAYDGARAVAVDAATYAAAYAYADAAADAAYAASAADAAAAAAASDAAHAAAASAAAAAADAAAADAVVAHAADARSKHEQSSRDRLQAAVDAKFKELLS
jgi:hypothetical protein